MKHAKQSKKRAFITGLTGQDGYYLSLFLKEKGYKLYGLVRRSSTNPFARYGGEIDGVTVFYGDLRDSASLARALEASCPHEIYNLAAQSDVGISFKCPEETMETNYFGVGRLIHEAVKINPRVRIYQASTSEMFGATPPPHNERAPFHPVSPYGEAKLKAHEDYVVGYRKRHGIYVCSGILFNHESPHRGEHFVTRKITRSFAKIKRGQQELFELGNLDARRDWGYAGDYVEAMWLMLQQEKPDDFVIATGESRTVRDFVNAAAGALGETLAWSGKGLREVGRDKEGKVRVRVNKKFYRPTDVHFLTGDSRKARRKLGWEPKTSFDELVRMMVLEDYRNIK